MSEPHAITISTHVLDTALGRPAAGMDVTLERVEADGSMSRVGGGRTDADGRIAALMDAQRAGAPTASGPSVFRLCFATEGYLATAGRTAFYPEIAITFRTDPADPRRHYHVPLLLNPFGYTTYRGS